MEQICFFLQIIYFFRFVVGPYEESNYAQKRSNQQVDTFYRQQINSRAGEPSSSYLSGSRSGSVSKSGKSNILSIVIKALKVYKRSIYQLKCGIRSHVCPHPFSCLYYILSVRIFIRRHFISRSNFPLFQGGIKQFSVGFGLQLCLKLLLNAKRIIKRPKHMKTVVLNKNILSLGLFLGGYSSLYRVSLKLNAL